MHRVGRTARAGHAGRALTIVTQYDVELYQRIESLIGLKLDTFPVPDEVNFSMSSRCIVFLTRYIFAHTQATVLSINERVAEAQRIAVQVLVKLTPHTHTHTHTPHTRARTKQQ